MAERAEKAAEEEEEEYQVESILTHLEYVEAFELRGYIVFNPVTGQGSKHSRYVYLVKWLGYEDADNTWEPEENLVDCTELLLIYKEKHGLPLYHETFERVFNWREPTTSLTLEEVNRLAFKNRDPVKSASQLVRDPPIKNRSKGKEVVRVGGKDSDVEDEEYSPWLKTKRSSPGASIKATGEVKRKRGAKKTTAENAPPKKKGRRPRVPSIDRERKSDSESKIIREQPRKVEKKSKEMEKRVELVRYVFDGGSRRSRSPAKTLLEKRRYSSAERLPERWFPAVKENAIEDCLKMAREKMAKIFTAHFAKSSENLSHRRQMIVSMRERKVDVDQQRQYRVVGSSLLKKFLKENNVSCKLPIIRWKVPSKSAPCDLLPDQASSENSHNTANANLSCEASKSGDRSGFGASGPVVMELRKYAHQCSILDAECLWKSICNERSRAILSFPVPAVLWELQQDDVLAIALSYAELSYKLTVQVLRSIDNIQQRFELVKKLVNTVRIVGNSNVCRPDRSSTSSDSLSIELVESDLSSGSWLEAVSHCSASHWKCRIIYQLISICPKPEVFLDEESPFNMKLFLHCMRYGAHCQKLAFIRSGIPHDQGTVECDVACVRVGSPHVVALQGNPRYLFEFIQEGFDMNSLTTKTSENRFDPDVTLSCLLTKLLKVCQDPPTGVMNGAVVDSGELGLPTSHDSSCALFELSFENRKALLNILGIVSDWVKCLCSFVRENVEKRLNSDPRCEVAFEKAVSPCRVRTALFDGVPTPVLTRVLAAISRGEVAMVLCIYSISIAYVPVVEEGCSLPLHLRRELIPDCKIDEARLFDDFQNYSCTLNPDPSSTSETEWYFVLDIKDLETATLRTTVSLEYEYRSLVYELITRVT